MLNSIKLQNALLITPISMAKISGIQSARESVRLFTETLLPFVPESATTTDIALITTEGLYMNDSGNAFDLRKKLWGKSHAFRRKFEDGIVQAQKDNPRILPDAYEIETFDTVRNRCHRPYRELLGLLYNELSTNPAFMESLVTDLDAMGQPYSSEKVSFLLEEYVCSWLFYTAPTGLRQQTPRRQDTNGQIVVCYAGALSPSHIEAYRILSHASGRLPHNRCMYLNTITLEGSDIAEIVQRLDLTSPLRKAVPYMKVASQYRHH